jgi:signal transduction histidine kinase
MRRLPLNLLQWSVFATCLMDGILLSMLVLATGGYNSLLFWLFLALIVRSSVIVPRATSQIALNLTLSACFMFAGFIDVFLAKNLDETERAKLGLSAEYPPEPVLVRLSLLLMLTVCCYGVQVLLERQRRGEEEAREFGLREGQLRSAGRLAAEFAHQLKNPLAIINNAVFSLERSLRDNQNEAVEQIEMIQEEVQRADRIITDVMGYAQLSEGHVERLDALEELDQAISRVFPPAARYPIRVHREYAGNFPPLFMQRRHVGETLINVLQNAREALQPQGGNVFISAHCLEDHAIEISIRDDGPGIPPEKQGQIFEAYYTTKEKGTGLGLATVKNNVELYGGRVRVESALGKGARFVLVFPTKTLIPAVKTS